MAAKHLVRRFAKLTKLPGVKQLKAARYLSAKTIEKAVNKKMESYKNLTFLEQYAMYMGKAQLLELALKGLLAKMYKLPFESMEKWTLGRVRNELRQRGLRKDFIAYLSEVVEHRNYVAHELLANTAITKNIANFSDRKLYGEFFRAVEELEHIIVLYDWTEAHNAW